MEISAYLTAAAFTFAAVAVFLIWIGLKAQNTPNLTGDAAMVGETGVVKKTGGFRNRTVVEVRGENWWSRPAVGTQLKPGDEIVVKDIDRNDLVLIIEPLETGRS